MLRPLHLHHDSSPSLKVYSVKAPSILYLPDSFVRDQKHTKHMLRLLPCAGPIRYCMTAHQLPDADWAVSWHLYQRIGLRSLIRRNAGPNKSNIVQKVNEGAYEVLGGF